MSTLGAEADRLQGLQTDVQQAEAQLHSAQAQLHRTQAATDSNLRRYEKALEILAAEEEEAVAATLRAREALSAVERATLRAHRQQCGLAANPLPPARARGVGDLPGVASSPLAAPAMLGGLDSHGTRRDSHGARLDRPGACLDSHGIRLDSHGTRLDRPGARLDSPELGSFTTPSPLSGSTGSARDAKETRSGRRESLDAHVQAIEMALARGETTLARLHRDVVVPLSQRLEPRVLVADPVDPGPDRRGPVVAEGDLPSPTREEDDREEALTVGFSSFVPLRPCGAVGSFPAVGCQPPHSTSTPSSIELPFGMSPSRQQVKRAHFFDIVNR